MRLFLDRWRHEEGERMDEGSTSPTTADVAEGQPPADEPLALVKKVKIKEEPKEEEEEKPMVRETRKNPATSSANVLTVNTTGTSVPQNVLYTYTNGVIPTVPQLVDLIPTAVNGKSVRPFKAYNANRELLTGLPTVTYPSAVPGALSGSPGAAVPLSIPTVVVLSNSVPAASSNGRPNAHLMTLATEADKLLQKDTKNGHIIKTKFDEAMTPGSTSGGSDSGSLLEETIEKIKKRAGIKTEKNSPPPASTVPQIVASEATPPSKPANSSSKKSKKSKNASPDPMRDGHYWERRRKNNEAAKRSRDARRAKEDQIAIRAALLEQENMRLRIELAALKEETVKLRAMLYNKK